MNRRPSILVVTSTYPRWAGDSHPRFVHDLSARLARHADVTVVAPTSHGAAREEVVDGVTVRRFAYWRDRPGLLRDGPALPTLRRHPTTALQVPTYLAAMYAAVRRELRDGQVDAIHAHWILPQGALAHLARGRGAGPRLLVTSHGADAFGLDALAPLSRWTLRRADAVTGVSQAVMDRLVDLGLPAATPGAVEPMGLDDHLFRPDPQARALLRARHGVDGPLALFAGRLSAKKGVDVLLDAMARLASRGSNATLAVVGTGEDEQQLRSRARELGLDGTVTFHGFQPHEQLAHWYAAADVFVGPSVVARGGDTEGFGLVFAEALASGCPVVASDLPAIRDVVAGSPGATTVPPGDPDALADAVQAMLADAPAARARTELDRARVVGRWGWDAVAARYLDLLVPGGSA